MREVSKKDWNLFRERIGTWQQKYMDRLNREYIELLNSDAEPEDKFWALEKRIRKDKKSPGVIIELSKSEMFYNLLDLINCGVITLDDLEGFSDELKESVKNSIDFFK